AAAEVKYQYQPAKFQALDVTRGAISVRNNELFTNLNEFTAKWALLEDGTTISEGTLTPEEINVAPLETRLLQVPIEPRVSKPGAEYWLNITLQLPEDTTWAKAGHEVASA